MKKTEEKIREIVALTMGQASMAWIDPGQSRTIQSEIHPLVLRQRDYARSRQSTREIAMEESEANALVTECSSLSVIDAESYGIAATKRGMVKAGMEYFDDLYDPRISEANKIHKNLIADKRRFYEPLAIVYDRIGCLLSHFDSQMEARRQQAQREADRQKEEEKQRLAEVARELGATEAAVAIERAPVEPEVVAKPLPKVEGLSYREDWRFEIQDEAKIPREYLSVDSVKIGKVVRALKGQTKIPGVRVYVEKTAIQRNT